MTGGQAETPLARIVGTWSDVDRWSKRLQTPLRPPDGSELAEDDKDFIGWPMSQLVSGGLAAARDHLQAIRIHIEAHNMFPFASGTLLRGGLLGAAQVVWLLAPDDRDTRLERSRTLGEEMMIRHEQYLADLRRIASEPHANTERVHQHVTMRLGEMRSLRSQHDQRGKFNATETIELAAEATFGPQIKTEARAEWRGLSGSAHGLAWSMIGRTGNTVTPTDDPNTVEITAGGDLSDYLNAYLMTYWITVQGWDLLDRRSATH